MRLRTVKTIWGVLLAIVVAGCSARGPQLDQFDAEALYRHGMERFEARRWADASEAFDRFVFSFPGHARQQEVRYFLGETFFQRREYLTAATEFIRLAADYPMSEYADDARFRACEAYVQLSPHPRREQSYTHAAIEHCEALIAYYPESEHVPDARRTVMELRTQLAEKEFLTAEDYRRMRAFDSAIIYYSFVLNNFPDTPVVPRALLRLYQVYDRLDYEQEREEMRQRLLRDFPDSAEAREVRAVVGAPSAP
jgi:outer membrane protein assembly factor BamD